MKDSRESAGLSLALTTLHLECRQHSGDYSCRVSFDLHRNNPILIEPLESVAPDFATCSQSDPYFVTIPFVHEPVECFVSTASWNSDDLRITLIPKRSGIFIDQPRLLIRVNAGLVNLGHYEHRKALVRHQFSLSDGEWSLDFTPVLETILLYPPEIQNAEYFFTHHLELRKIDGSSFTAAEAHEELQLLCSFLSFCHGHWVSTALTFGIAEDGTVAMEEWGTHIVSPWQRAKNWLDEHNGNCIVELYPLFVKRMKDPDWREAIEQSIYWKCPLRSILRGA